MLDATTLTTLAGLLTTMGGSGAALWRHVDKKFAEIHKKLEDCQQRDEANRNGLHVVSMGCALLIEEVRTANPSNRTLQKVATLLKGAFPAEPGIPASWSGLLEALEEAHKS